MSVSRFHRIGDAGRVVCYLQPRQIGHRSDGRGLVMAREIDGESAAPR